MGKKAARDADCRSLAIQAYPVGIIIWGATQNEWITSLFTALNIVKCIENGAWFGIGSMGNIY